ncbi:MAG: glutathione S-transferase family protein [Solirubrobacteraceae bacterium]
MAAIARGAFVRAPSDFREQVWERPAAGRYHLYVAAACPWSHRTMIVRELLGLQELVSISYVDPLRDQRGWAFTGGRYVDQLNGFRFMAEGYVRSAPEFAGRVSVPVLWDAAEDRILNNESSEIIRMFNAWAGGELYPPAQRAEIDAVNERVYETVNDGVYRAGFGRTQEAYEHALAPLFETLVWLDSSLGERRYLLGERLTEADWRLYPTLARFDCVYNSHFKCNLRRLVDLPNLWGYTRELYQVRGVAATTDFAQIKRHYFMTHGSLNPSRIVPAGPLLDFEAPHGRG